MIATSPSRRICVVTGARSEYGLLREVMKKIADHPDLDLQLVATGAHLDRARGHTIDDVVADGFRIDAQVDMLVAGDSALSAVKSLGLATMNFGETLSRLQPDLMVVLGDRYEILAAAQAAMLLLIPIAHIHGGEATEGAVDEATRHAVTKMSQLHFVAAEAYRRRVIQLGEAPDRVFNVGALAVDAFLKMTPFSRDELQESLGVDLGEKFFLVTYHPVTLADTDPADAVEALFAALAAFPDYRILVTGVNADPGSEAVARAIRARAADAPGRVFAFQNLGQDRYYSAMRHCAAVIGNSSSGLIEAPLARVPTVNLGDRQKGRLRADSVIDCAEDSTAIEAAVHRAVGEAFAETVATCAYPFGDGNAAAKVVGTLAAVETRGLTMKRFNDLPAAAIVQ